MFILGPAVVVLALTLTASATVFRGDSPLDGLKKSLSSSSSGGGICMFKVVKEVLSNGLPNGLEVRRICGISAKEVFREGKRGFVWSGWGETDLKFLEGLRGLMGEAPAKWENVADKGGGA